MVLMMYEIFVGVAAMQFKNKKIIITGGSSGIGEATAKLFAEQGAIVYNLDYKTPDYKHDAILTYFCDVTDYKAIEATLSEIIAKESAIDFLFANAGAHLFANIEDTTLEDIDRIINVNLKGTYYILKSVIPFMKKENKGSIVLCGSDQSLVGKGGSSIYGVTKAAIGQLTKSTAIDYAKYNIRVNCICPGTIDTPLYHHAVKTYSEKTAVSKEQVYESLAKAQPIQRVGTASEVANVVAFLLSDDAAFMTGALISVDGGYTAQ